MSTLTQDFGYICLESHSLIVHSFYRHSGNRVRPNAVQVLEKLGKGYFKSDLSFKLAMFWTGNLAEFNVKERRKVLDRDF